MIVLRLKVPGSNPTLIFSLSFLSLFYVVSVITERQRTLLMKIFICDYIICDSPFSHMGQELSMAVRDFSVSVCLSHPWIKLLSPKTLTTVHYCYV